MNEDVAGNKGKQNDRKKNNYERANPISKMFFCWMLPTFMRGMKSDLEEKNLSLLINSHVSRKLGDKLERAWFEEQSTAKKRNRDPSLKWTLFKTFFLAYVPSGLLTFTSAAILKSLSPLFLSNMLHYWDIGNSTVSRNGALMYATVLVVSIFLVAVIQQHAIRLSLQFGMSVRVACSSLIYRKVLRMDMASLSGTSAARVVNLMANDVSRFDSLFIFLHYMWIGPVQVSFICYLMYREVRWMAFVGILTIIVQTLPIQLYMSKLLANLRFAIAQRTDERVRLMTEIITGIEVIKMYAWEQPFEKVVAASRKSEMDKITKASYARSVNHGFMAFAERTTLFVMVLTFYLKGEHIVAAVVFSLYQYFSILKLLFALHIPNGLSFLAESIITIRRIESFLVLREREDLSEEARSQLAKNKVAEKLSRKLNGKSHKDGGIDNGFGNTYINYGMYDDSNNANIAFPSKELAICVENVTARWEEDRSTPTLDNITLRVPKGKLCAIIGSVGSGKSSLLNLLLDELRVSQGEVCVSGGMSYSCQEPWLFGGTARENILFGLPYEEQRYQNVIRVCALRDDFAQFPHGDQSLVGERGLSLSGGQRARINLARAVYRQADIYLLDDPLSAVDAVVGRQLFDNCINGYLNGKTCLLVTHQLHYLRNADIIVVMNNGCIETMGTFDDLISSGVEFVKQLEALQEDTKTEEEGDENKKEIRRRSLAATEVQDKPEYQGEGETLAEEERALGSQGAGLYFQYFRAGSNCWFLLGLISTLIITQTIVTFTDFWVSHWTNRESSYLERYSHNATERKTFFDGSRNYDNFNRGFFLHIYSALTVLCVIMGFTKCALFYKFCMKSSIGLHDRMFNSLLKGVMRFFNVNPSGRILNRFSKDIGAVDEMLPSIMEEAVHIYLSIFGTVVLVAISLPWSVITATVLLLYFYGVLTVYLRSARAIKRLEGNSKSPVFSHLSSTLRGISTIRCTKSQNNFVKDFDQLQDNHTSIWSEYISSSCSLGFWLDASVSVYLLIVSYIFLFAKDLTPLAGNVGLAMSQILTLNGSLPYGVKQTAEVINQMTGVERVLQYTKIEKEKTWSVNKITKPDNWPSNGAIKMKNTNLRYATDKPLVLVDLNVEIQAGWKVGIVGRTGAGKTSLISALFRLADVEGTTSIDGIDTGLLSLKDLRSSISIIPQQPVLFSASLRYNLDPFNKYNDAELWEALEAVELKTAVSSLDFKILQGGSNFSIGQRQLICLARAMLKKNKILVMDEATANVDPQTDGFIQQTIRTKFSECTVLTIAHRLNTIMDSDRVLVMSFGKAVEFDHPYTLLGREDGVFTSMVKETGPKMAAQLNSVAMESFLAVQEKLSNLDIK